MFVGSARIEFEIVDGATLKDKRRVVRSVLEKLRNRYHLAAAEVDRLNDRRRAGIGVAVVANDRRFVESVLSQVAGFLEADPRLVVSSNDCEIWAR
jgi:uncharacterized protein YlxP (DUF503 family)